MSVRPDQTPAARLAQALPSGYAQRVEGSQLFVEEELIRVPDPILGTQHRHREETRSVSPSRPRAQRPSERLSAEAGHVVLRGFMGQGSASASAFSSDPIDDQLQELRTRFQREIWELERLRSPGRKPRRSTARASSSSSHGACTQHVNSTWVPSRCKANRVLRK